MQISMCKPSFQIFNRHQMHQWGLEEDRRAFKMIKSYNLAIATKEHDGGGGGGNLVTLSSPQYTHLFLFTLIVGIKAVVRYEQSRGGRVSLLMSLSSRRQLAMVCWHSSCRLETLCSTLTTYSAGPEAISRRESLWPQQIEMMGRCVKSKRVQLQKILCKRSFAKMAAQQVIARIQHWSRYPKSSRNLKVPTTAHRRRMCTSEIIQNSSWCLFSAFYSECLKLFTQGISYQIQYLDRIRDFKDTGCWEAGSFDAQSKWFIQSSNQSSSTRNSSHFTTQKLNYMPRDT